MKNAITTPIVTWDTVRTGLVTVQALGQRYLLGKAFVGWQLSVMKAENGSFGSGRKKVADSATLTPWPELVERETGLKRRTADELIRLWEAALARHKRLRGPAENRKLIGYLENSDPLSIQIGGDESADFANHFGYILDGETAAHLMQELGVIPKPIPMPDKKGDPKKQDKDITAGQLAFHFFDGLGSSLINTRMSPDYQKLLHALPLHSTEEQPLSLTTLETEARALVADIERIKADAAKHTNPLRRI